MNVVWFVLGYSPAHEFRPRGITQKKAYKICVTYDSTITCQSVFRIKCKIVAYVRTNSSVQQSLWKKTR